MTLPPRSTGRDSQAGSLARGSPLGGEVVAGDRKQRRRATATRGRPHPPRRWSPPLSDWTVHDTADMGRGVCELRMEVSQTIRLFNFFLVFSFFLMHESNTVDSKVTSDFTL